MDPVTQGALGAAAAQLGVGHRLGRKTWLLGAAGGMAADLDIFIRSSADPLLAIEYHRHFTHSLSFVPIGGALVALPWILRQRYRKEALWIVLATTLGYATHGLLDACTTYGTLLAWPFSNHRVSWGLISIVDLAFTLPLIAAVVLSARAQPNVPRARRFVAVGLAWCIAYLSLGAWQHHRADEAQRTLAAMRGHTIERSDVFVGFLSQMAWRSVYRAGDRTYVDKIRVPYLGSTVVTPGASTVTPDTAALEQRYNADAATARGLRLIRWFSSGWIAHHDTESDVITDLRYGFGPTSLTPMWGVRLKPRSDIPVTWYDNKSARNMSFSKLAELMFGDGPDAMTLDGKVLREDHGSVRE